MKMIIKATTVLCLTSILFIMTSCGKNEGDDTTFDIDTLPSFDVTSADLHDGVWDSVITNTDNGSNVSPQLSWEPVDGADSYVIYMIDNSAGNWLHWKSNGVTETKLPQGAAPAGEYVGPYPPSGTHDYEVYVFAMENLVNEIGGKFDAENKDFDNIVKQLNEDGNIVGCGRVKGTYTKGD